jgi:hypothetical protein
MAKAARDGGNPDLHALFEEFDGRLVSPGGAAAILGVSRKTVDTLCKRGRLRRFDGPDERWGPLGLGNGGPRWAYIPLVDLAVYAEHVGRPFPKGSWAYGMPPHLTQ